MGERKVLNKYYPPDFDPSKIPRLRLPKNRQMKVRMMLPMSIRCNTCGNYIYKGTKFNSRKEDVVGETYLGIQIFRFYFKCTKCSAEITYKTDPKNSDYTVEAGATRNFEPWRSEDEAIDEAKKKRDAEEMGDSMKALENRTLDSKREMDIISTLDELISMKARHQAIGTEVGLEALRRSAELKEKELAEEDERILQTVVFHNSSNFVRRIEEDGFSDSEDAIPSKKAKSSIYDQGADPGSAAASILIGPQGAAKASTFTKPQFLIKPKRAEPEKVQVEQKQSRTALNTADVVNNVEEALPANKSSTGLASLCAYHDDDDSTSE
ncbi:hypothetical protein KP509_19G017800 [Ceratopteris richardii]|uniref:Splicing factor YJU2 n=1 Tax=Ceratopteris richardii TaxID=49495 RepID=A0A8T2SK72_CERRI|nr:hypothetical protein KP509_19G017800 [Ceratopteris richardii]KAH7351863.1 hypothetical protein KP509_19G017800 [Ceratopteris richardii]KAH7351864.1 hypothetical protein KP509_19G017800 [Ceratopteris richardii]